MNTLLPKVSIVTLTYKKFDKLYQTVNSVLSQDYDNIELIISDDGSDNFPESQLQEYLSEHNKNNIQIQILQNKKNVGTVKNANKAYEKAGGDYIFNLSCGDVFFSNQIVRILVDRFDATNAEILVTSRLAYENDFVPLYLLPHYEERKILEKLDTNLKQYKAFTTSQFYDMASGSAMYFRKDIIEKYNYYDEKYILWEDGPFLSKYLWDHKLEMAYDIISIWYETGGVSDQGERSVNKIMQNDVIAFSLSDKISHFDVFTKSEKKRIEYRTKRLLVKNKNERLCLYLKYLPQWFSFLRYYKKRQKYSKRDLMYIKNLI